VRGNRWFEEFSVLEPINTEVVDRAKILSAEIVSRERNAIKALAILLGDGQRFSGRQTSGEHDQEQPGEHRISGLAITPHLPESKVGAPSRY
jgi:hypothetical protein